MSKKIFSLTNDDAKKNRRKRILLIGTFALFILAILIVLLVYFMPRLLHTQKRECRKRLLEYFNKFKLLIYSVLASIHLFVFVRPIIAMKLSKLAKLRMVNLFIF